MREAQRRFSPTSLLWLVLSVGALAAGAGVLLVAEAGRGVVAPPYSVQRTDDQGMALLFRFCRAAGLAPQEWEHDYTRLRAPGLLLLADPPAHPTVPATDRRARRAASAGDILPYEIEALDRWVQAGSVLVVLSDEDNVVYEALGISPGAGSDPPVATAVSRRPGVLSRGVKQLELLVTRGFRFRRPPAKPVLPDLPAPAPTTPLVPADDWVELFGGADPAQAASRPIVAAAARGKGLYLVVAQAHLASNLGILDGDNAQFLLNLAALRPDGGAFWFDEYHRRPVTRGLMAYLADRALSPAVLYLLVLLGGVLWRANTPLGPVRRRREESPRTSREYVRALATLHQAADLFDEGMERLWSDLQRQLGVRGRAQLPAAELAQHWSTCTGRPPDEAEQVLGDIAGSRRGNGSGPRAGDAEGRERKREARARPVPRARDADVRLSLARRLVALQTAVESAQHPRQRGQGAALLGPRASRPAPATQHYRKPERP